MLLFCFLIDMSTTNFIHQILYSDAGNNINNVALLFFRILLAAELFRVHGMKKFRLENGLPEQIPNPLHLPERLNKLVAVFSDTIAPFLLMLGIASRLVILPTIGVTTIGYFVVHRKDSPEVRDIPYMYTLCLLFIWVVGPGSFSIDQFLLHKIS